MLKKFGALAQNVLKDTIDEMKKAKARESNLELYKRIFQVFLKYLILNQNIN